MIPEARFEYVERVNSYSSGFFLSRQCEWYDILDDIKWIVGSMLLDWPDQKLQYFAQYLDIKPKKKWDRTKYLVKIFKTLFYKYDVQQIWVSLFMSQIHDLTYTICDEDTNPPVERIALALRCMGRLEEYEVLISLSYKEIISNIKKIKTKIMPYLQQNTLSTEILDLHREIAYYKEGNGKLLYKLKNEQELSKKLSVKLMQTVEQAKTATSQYTKEIEKNRNRIRDLELKIKSLKTTVKALSDKLKKTIPDSGPELKGIVVWFDNLCQIATPEGFIPVTPHELRENRLLNGDIVLVRGKDPLDLVLRKPSGERRTGEGIIECIDDLYVVNVDTIVTVGHTSEYLPLNCLAQISYTPDGNGVVERILDIPEEKETKPNKPLKQLNTVYVAGGVKESIYRDVIDIELLWSRSDEKRTEMINPKVQKADVVFLIIPYLSHNAYYHIKAACIKYEVPLVLVSTTGQSGFLEAYNKCLTEAGLYTTV